MMQAFKKLFLSCLVIAAVALFAASNSCAQEPTLTRDQTPEIKSAIETIRQGLWKAQAAGFITPDDFEALDFSSGDIWHGWKPKYKNAPQEKLGSFYIAGENLEPRLKEEIATLTNKGQPFVTLRRYKYTKRGDMDFLYLVIPSVKKTKCGDKGVDDMATVISQDVIFTDKKILAGCIRMKDKTINLFFPIIYRLRISATDRWEIELQYPAVYGVSPRE